MERVNEIFLFVLLKIFYNHILQYDDSVMIFGNTYIVIDDVQ